MIKLYKRIFILFILFIIIINIASFAAGLDKRQLFNFFFYSERTAAVYYIAKHIVFESGIYLKRTSPALLDESIDGAAAAYDIDSDLLRMLTVPENEFKISVIGGMGLTSITPAQFRKTGLADPYNYNENIIAAAKIIQQLKLEGVADNSLISTYMLHGTIPETLKILSPSYFTYVKAISEERR